MTGPEGSGEPRRPEGSGEPQGGAPIDRASLARRIYQTSHLTGTFVLRSGVTSSEYFDKYRFEADPALLREIGAAMARLLPDRVDALAGLELGGVPLATVLSQLTGLPAAFVRKQAKPYGTRRLAEGADLAGRRIVVVEDVVTSGGAVVGSCAALREQGAEVAAAVCVIDREQGGAANLAAVGVELRPLFTMGQLVGAMEGR
jgi:orotate phosphoribosyltransferase